MIEALLIGIGLPLVAAVFVGAGRPCVEKRHMAVKHSDAGRPRVEKCQKDSERDARIRKLWVEYLHERECHARVLAEEAFAVEKHRVASSIDDLVAKYPGRDFKEVFDEWLQQNVRSSAKKV